VCTASVRVKLDIVVWRSVRGRSSGRDTAPWLHSAEPCTECRVQCSAVQCSAVQ
jgi:hypothetical protein